MHLSSQCLQSAINVYHKVKTEWTFQILFIESGVLTHRILKNSIWIACSHKYANKILQILTDYAIKILEKYTTRTEHAGVINVKNCHNYFLEMIIKPDQIMMIGKKQRIKAKFLRL